MSLWRRGGICGSPVSSVDDDDGDVFAYDDADDVGDENAQENAPRAKKKPATKATKQKSLAKTAAKAPQLKRRRRSDKAASGKEEEDAPLAKTQRVLSKKELVRGAPQRFVEYLADQLASATQAQYCEEYGAGQGVMLRMPTSWSEVRERRAFGEWAVRLGFVASKVHRHLHRISSLNVEIVLAELRTRVRVQSESVSFPLDDDVSMSVEVDAEPEPRSTEDSTSYVKGEEAKPAVSSKREEAASLQTFKEHFQRLDLEHLEMLTAAEHDRLLSTIRHEQIADAMEEVLARPSVRKDRDRARRMSKLGRIAERRLSIIPMRPSMLHPTILEDAEWDENDLDEEFAQLQAPETIMEEDEEDLMDEETVEKMGEADATTMEEEAETGDAFITPRKSTSATRSRRSSVGSIGSVKTPGRRVSFGSKTATPTRGSARIASSTPAKTPESKPLTTPKRSPGSKPLATTPLRTPIRTPKKTMLQTPTGTPLRTPRRSSLSAFGPRRSSISKLGMAELKRWRVVGRNVLGSLFSSGFLGVRDLKAAFDVSKIWREFAIPAYAWSVADYTKQNHILSMDKIYAGCPRGHYLSDGAYKEVFKVFSAHHKRLEAVSVMDIRAIESTGNQHIVRQEVAHSLLLSELVRSRFSPHFVEIYDVFLARERPHTKRWGSAECRKPVDLLTGRKLVGVSRMPEDPPSDSDGLFQYIHMEFCDGGDVEDFIGLQENQLLPVSSVVIPFFFQMVFSVYSARERFNMRHCDIKLLNFFLKDISRKGLKCAQDEPLTLQYTIGDDAFNLQMPATFSYWVKLADYGTADSNVENLGKPVTLDQFTTLENTPIEFLLEGDQALQSFAADTFSLGLCLLHLFTGCAPYEEILEDVKCPAPLLQDLKRLWMSGKKNSPFSVLRRVGQDDTEDVLMHTLYRYVVLFNLPTENPSATKQIDRVWTLLIKHLRPDDETGNLPLRQSSRRAATSKKAVTKMPTEQFQEDYARFSIACGTHPIIKRARDRMARVVGAQELLLSLVAFNPSDRPTMKRTLFHDVFKTMRVVPSGNTKSPRLVHYTVDCYAAAKFPADRLPDV